MPFLSWYAQEDCRLDEACARMGRNDPCPCGTKDREGKAIKFKRYRGQGGK